MTKSSTLKNRLLLKRMSRQIKSCEDDNFGYSPSGDVYYDNLLEKRNKLANIVLDTDYEWWIKYSLAEYAYIDKAWNRLNIY